MDPVDGPILASLLGNIVKLLFTYISSQTLYQCREGDSPHMHLFMPLFCTLAVGPCALEYTKMKTADHFWTDPSADELVQRHRIHSGHCRQDSPTKRPALCVRFLGRVEV